MTTPGKPRVIALEEHYWDREIAATFDPLDGVRGAPGIAERLFDYGELRIKEMDEAGAGAFARRARNAAHGCRNRRSPRAQGE